MKLLLLFCSSSAYASIFCIIISCTWLLIFLALARNLGQYLYNFYISSIPISLTLFGYLILLYLLPTLFSYWIFRHLLHVLQEFSFATFCLSNTSLLELFEHQFLQNYIDIYLKWTHNKRLFFFVCLHLSYFFLLNILNSKNNYKFNVQREQFIRICLKWNEKRQKSKSLRTCHLDFLINISFQVTCFYLFLEKRQLAIFINLLKWRWKRN